MQVQEIETRLDTKKKEQSDLKSKLAENVKRATKMKVDNETAVKNGEDEAKLDKMDEELFKLDRERTRIEIRLTQCGVEIEALLRVRAKGLAEVEHEKYEQDATAAISEAKQLESLIQELVKRANMHWQRVQRLKRYADAAGVGQNPFKLSNLERRVTAIFHGGSVHATYEQAYDKILESNIASIEKQIGRYVAAEQSETVSSETNEAAAN